MKKIKRIFDKNNRMIYELDEDFETINKYDDTGNLIYTRTYNLTNNQIIQENEQEFDINNNLIHYKNSTIEEWYEYNDKNKIIVYRDSNNGYIQYMYDEKENILLELENDIEVKYTNTYK